jgi:hypothetical protein
MPDSVIKKPAHQAKGAVVNGKKVGGQFAPTVLPAGRDSDEIDALLKRAAWKYVESLDELRRRCQ